MDWLPGWLIDWSVGDRFITGRVVTQLCKRWVSVFEGFEFRSVFLFFFMGTDIKCLSRAASTYTNTWPGYRTVNNICLGHSNHRSSVCCNIPGTFFIAAALSSTRTCTTGQGIVIRTRDGPENLISPLCLHHFFWFRLYLLYSDAINNKAAPEYVRTYCFIVWSNVYIYGGPYCL